jgi:hypothetical protein
MRSRFASPAFARCNLFEKAESLAALASLSNHFVQTASMASSIAEAARRERRSDAILQSNSS